MEGKGASCGRLVALRDVVLLLPVLFSLAVNIFLKPQAGSTERVLLWLLYD